MKGTPEHRNFFRSSEARRLAVTAATEFPGPRSVDQPVQSTKRTRGNLDETAEAITRGRAAGVSRVRQSPPATADDTRPTGRTDF